MSLLDSVRRPRPGPPDDPIEGSLGALWDGLEPDPLFVRRLRSEAVNRFVSVREGSAMPAGDVRALPAMGRLGRACLYASFALGVSATSILAASQAALPGEPLYGLKLRIEQVRLEVLPPHLHDALDAYALAARIDEMGRLTAAGRWDQAIALTPAIEEAYERVLDRDARTDVAKARVERHLMVLQDLIDRLPDGARAAVQGVVDRMNDGAASGGGSGSNGAPPVNSNTGGNAGSGPPADPPKLDVPGQADQTPAPERTPRPERTPKPAPQLEPDAPIDAEDEGQDDSGD
ncbi:MAG: hypothetical protein ACRDFY_00260 [Candidatus Limnocylindria bacterium]